MVNRSIGAHHQYRLLQISSFVIVLTLASDGSGDLFLTSSAKLCFSKSAGALNKPLPASMDELWVVSVVSVVSLMHGTSIDILDGTNQQFGSLFHRLFKCFVGKYWSTVGLPQSQITFNTNLYNHQIVLPYFEQITFYNF